MSGIGDFFSTLFHGGKTQSKKTASENATTDADKIQGYGEINGETVQVVDDETRGERRANAILNLPNTIGNFWNSLIWDQATSKQDVDNMLMGLKYNGENTTKQQKDKYIQDLSTLQSLRNKDTLTLDEAIYANYLDNDLNNYTVPDVMNNGKIDGNRLFGYDGIFGWLRSDRSREKSILNDKDAKRGAVDREKILESLNSHDGRTWNYFGAADPSKKEDTSMKVMTESEYKTEKAKTDIDTRIDDLIQQKAQQAVDSFFIAPGNPGGRKSTTDEVLGLFEVAMQDRSIQTNLESYKELYAEIKGKAPELEKYVAQKAVDIVDMMTYILTANKESEDAYKEYLETHDNPFEFDVAKMDYSKLNNYEKTLLYANPMTTMRVGTDALGLEDEVGNTTIWDGYYTANSILRAAKLGENLSDLDLIGASWNALEYAGAAIGGVISSAFGTVLALSNSAADLVQNGTLKESDFNSYLFGWQSSSIYNLKQNYQSEWANPDYFGADIAYVARQYGSILDDLISARFIAKLDFPVKIADLAMVNKVLVKGKQLEKAVETGTKIAKTGEKVASVANTTEKIVTGAEKLEKAIKAETFFGRVKNGIKSWFTKDQAIKEAEEAVKLGLKDTVMLSGKNIANWLADEMISSAVFQGMTPYEYSEEDLSMDMFGAVFSGLLRIKAYNNRMGIFKHDAMNSVWTQWYLTEVKGMDPADAVEYMGKMDKASVNGLGAAIKAKFSELLDSDTVMTRKDMKSKAQLMGEESRKLINNLIDETVHNSEQYLMKQLASSMDSRYSKLVKKGKVVKGDGTVVEGYVWNKPKGVSNASWKKTVRKAREVVYSPKGLNDVNTIAGRSKLLNKIKKYVKDNLPAMAARGSKATRDLVEKVDGKWRFKKGVSKDVINKLYTDRLQRFIDRSPYRGLLTVKGNKLIEGGAGKDTWFGFGVWDYVKHPVGPIGQRIAMYINDQIKGKKMHKNDLVNGLSVLGAGTQRVFKRWVKEVYGVTDYGQLSNKQLASYMMEFAHELDERIFPDYTRRGQMREAGMDALSGDEKYLANRTYEDACDPAKGGNEDLKYMSPEMFHEITNDPELSLMQKEIKLRGYTRRVINDRNIYGIAPGKKQGVIVFGDTYEEKRFFGDKGVIYIKSNKKGAQEVINNRKGKKASKIPVFDRKGEGVKRFTYKLSETDDVTGRKTYTIYDGDKPVGYIYTKGDYTLPKGQPAPDGMMKYSTERQMTVQLFEGATEGEFKSVEFEVVKDKNSYVKTQKFDVSTKLPDEKRVLTGKYFDKEMGGEVPETTLGQWNAVSTFIRQGNKSYSAFTKLIPGYTDRVPEAFFNMVMKDKEWRDVDKMNLLIGVMFNKSLSETSEGFRFDLTKKRQFNRRGYTFYKRVKNADGEYVMAPVSVASDAEIFYTNLSDGGGGVVLVKIDGQEAAEKFYYKIGKNPMEFEIYKTPDDKKPVGVISFGSDRVRGYINEPGGRKLITGTIEFMHSADEEFVSSALSKRYGKTSGKIVVGDGDEMYKEIYRELYDGAEMPDALYYKLKSTPNMTPERYLESEINNIRNTRFGKFLTVKGGNWKNVIAQVKKQKYIIQDCNNYVKLFGNTTTLTDAEIYKAAEVYRDRLIKAGNGNIKLTKAEEEVKEIMYGKLYQYGPNNMINILGYQMFGKNPPSDLGGSAINRRLKNRRDAILMAIYKDQDMINSWSDAEKLSLISRLKRKLGRDIHGWQDVALSDVIEDIKKHPQEYNSIIDALSKKIAKEDAMKERADTRDLKIIEKAEKRIAEIEEQIGNGKPTKVKGPNTDKLTMKNYEAQAYFLQNKLNNLLAEKEEIAKLGDPARMAEVNRKIDAVMIAQRELEENMQYIKGKNLGDFTDEEFKYLADAQMRGEGVFEPGRMTNKEINKRVKFLKSRVPGMRVLEYDHATGQINGRPLTQRERKIYKDTLGTAADEIANGRARAVHLAGLHAMVIDPTNVNIFDLSHETFHEAVLLMTDQDRRFAVYEEAYTKFHDQIEEFGRRRGYDEQFDKEGLGELERQRALTEEWLAERFGEYVMGRLKLENSTIMRFFQELWEKIKLMFSDTEAMKLFEDIYDGRLQYNDIKIDLKPQDIKSDKFRLTSDATYDYINSGRIRYGDNLDVDELIRNVGYRDAAIVTNLKFSGRGNYFTSRKQVITLDNGAQIKASYDELFEGITTKEKELGIDNAIGFLYGDDGEFFNWISNKGGATYKTKSIGNGNAILEVMYPDDWDGERIAEFKLIIPNGGRGNTSFILDGIKNKTIQEIAAILSSSEYSNIIKAFQTSSISTEPVKMANIAPEDYAAHIRSMGPNYERFLNKYMPDALEQSIEEYIHAPRDISFEGYENIDRIENILNAAHRTLMFDRSIPHTNGAVNGSLFDIYQGLYRRKWERTKKLINDVNLLNDSKLTYEVGRSRGRCPTIQFKFTDNQGNVRAIGWHMSEEQLAEGKANGRWKYGTIDEMKAAKVKRMTAPAWNKSMLIDPEGTDYNRVAVVGKPMYERVRAARGYKTPISFRRTPYKIGGVTLNVDDSLGVVIQKNMWTDQFREALKNGGGISSSLAIVNKYRDQTGFGSVALIGRKKPTAFRKKLYEGMQVFGGDAFTPSVNTLIMGDIKLILADAYTEYLRSGELGVSDELKQRLNKELGLYFFDKNIFLEGSKNNWTDQAIINLMRWGDEGDLRDHKSKINNWVRDNIDTSKRQKDHIVSKLLGDEDYMNRIYDNAFEGQIAGMTKQLDEDDALYVELKKIEDEELGLQRYDPRRSDNTKNPKLNLNGQYPITSLGLVDVDRIARAARRSPNWDKIEASYIKNRLRDTDTFEDYVKSCIVNYQMRRCFDYFEGYSRKLDFRDYWGIVTTKINHEDILKELRDNGYKYFVIDPDLGYSAKEMEDIIDKYANKEKSFIVIKGGSDYDITEEGYSYAPMGKTKKGKFTQSEIGKIRRRGENIDTIEGNNNKYEEYRLGGATIKVPKNYKEFIIQKDMGLYPFIDLVNDGGTRISSSIGIKRGYEGTGFGGGDVSLIGRKRPTKWNDEAFKGLKVFSGDSHTPTVSTLMMLDAKLIVRDILRKQLDKNIDNYLEHALLRMSWDSIEYKPGFNDDTLINEIDEVLGGIYGFKISDLRPNMQMGVINWALTKWPIMDVSNGGCMEIWNAISPDDDVKVRGRNMRKAQERLQSIPGLKERIYDDELEGLLAGTQGGNSYGKWFGLHDIKDIDLEDIMLSSGGIVMREEYPKYVRMADEALTTMLQYIVDTKGRNAYIDAVSPVTGAVNIDKFYDLISDKPELINNYKETFAKELEMTWPEIGELSDKEFLKKLVIFIGLRSDGLDYLEGYQRVMNLSDFWGAIVSDKNYDIIKKAMEDKGYNIKTIDLAEKKYSSKEFEKMIDDIDEQKRGFILMKAGEDFTSKNIETLPEIDRRLANTNQLSDRTLRLLHAHGLDAPLIGVSTNRYVQNLEDINSTLSDYNYNMRRDAPQYYEEKKALNVKRKVRDSQTWANSKRRILNKEYRDLQKKVRYAKERMELRQERYDEFKESPAYFQATKIKEAIEQSNEAKKALLKARKETRTLIPEATQDYKAPKGDYAVNSRTVDHTPPFAKTIVTDNYYHIDADSPIREYVEGGDELLKANRDVSRINELNIIGGDVDICLPVSKISLSDPNLLADNVLGSKSFVIWATDSDTLNAFKRKIESEIPGYSNVYDRPGANMAYYMSDYYIKPADESTPKLDKTKAKQELEKQVEEDKNITEASLGSVIDSSLVCKL